MAKPEESYHLVVVESVILKNSSGHRGKVHLRPIEGQPFKQSVLLEGPKAMIDVSRYPVGTKFRVRAKLTDRENGGEFLYMHWSWPYEVIDQISKK
jgi:hypothetical protein